MSNINFSVSGHSLNPTKFETKARNFSFIVDEPPALGGNDEGPNPVEYLLGSYAGCLNVVINIVAKELSIKINKLEIAVDGDIDPSKFVGGFSFNRAGFQSINVVLNLETNATSAEEKKLIDQSKARCPINDNLSNSTQINYKLLEKVNLN